MVWMMTKFRKQSGPASCEETAEHISALCDGETIPRQAAQHISECGICKTRIEDYLRMGVELKRMAIASAPAKLAPIPWVRERRSIFNGWQIWRQTMGIPRIAFAFMLVLIAVLSFRIVTVRATGKQWFEMQVYDKDGNRPQK
jgi:hypothetical protein